MSLKDLPAKTFQFEKAHSTVQWKVFESAATGGTAYSLEVMVIDQYGFQREFSLAYRHEPGDSKDVYWESHIYQHPGRRHVIKRLGPSRCEAFIKRFLMLCEKYPSLLFNETGDHAEDKARPRCTGFITLAETLHRGALPSVKLL